jgi:hypothetical protein
MSRCSEPRCSQSSTNENAARTRPCRMLRPGCTTATSSSLKTHRRTPSLRSLPLRGLALLTAYILYPLPAHRNRLQHSPSPLLDTYMPDATNKLEFPPFSFRMAPRDHIERSILVPRRPRSTAFPTHSRRFPSSTPPSPGVTVSLARRGVATPQGCAGAQEWQYWGIARLTCSYTFFLSCRRACRSCCITSGTCLY